MRRSTSIEGLEGDRAMLIKRRSLLAASEPPRSPPVDPQPASAQAKQIQLAGASYDMRDAILGEFAKRTGITPRPFVNPSTQARIDRLRTAPVDVVLTRRAVRGLRQQREAAAADRHLEAAQLVDKMHPLLKDGRATPTAPLGYRRQSRPHDVCRRGAHQGVLRADVLPDGFDRLQRLQDPGREQRRCRGASCSIRSGAARSRCSASTGWAC